MTLMASLAEELAGEFRLQPLLEKILTNAVRLLGCRSGSICTIDHEAQTYRKEVDLDVHCQAGHVFRLDEGVTGAVVRAGAFVSFASYASVPRGHISRDDERFGSPVIGVPITVNDSMIGAFVVFAEPGHPFTAADAELLELFATHAAVAIVNSQMYSASLDKAVAAALESGAASGPAAEQPLESGAASGPAAEQPLDSAPPVTPSASPTPARLTAREKEVRNLVVKGLPDKQIATLLRISAKTVEKHVGAILHKCGVPNRTALAGMARAETDNRDGDGYPVAQNGYGGNPS
ncbi:MAG: hypothetical protein JWQ19_3464 [Subtercola sp.]|nr:hypothetical protein [Subtercola sp.]